MPGDVHVYSGEGWGKRIKSVSPFLRSQYLMPKIEKSKINDMSVHTSGMPKSIYKWTLW